MTEEQGDGAVAAWTENVIMSTTKANLKKKNKAKQLKMSPYMVGENGIIEGQT